MFDSPLSPGQREHATTIQKSAQDILALLNDMHGFMAGRRQDNLEGGLNDDGYPLWGGEKEKRMTQDSNKKNLRVLVIDDNTSIHEDFRKILQAKDGEESFDQARAALFGDPPLSRAFDRFELDCTDQGQAALTLVQLARNEGRPYAVAFVDMRMPPGWDGLETIERLWEVDAELQVVICTAYSDYPWDEIKNGSAKPTSC